ncbi:ClpXP protease specificity-enhancing factor [Reinekea blandensis]|uniref:Stringent starvation protein B n=1 Tax=Reinekea blandensis MED297 TaxID=314283 RepID=A4BF42_9GAMM|nr:ClpXP protease specificity-enhancing factor [Reinekea blandensis]EAR09155.1 stringent starvation protein B [Reinekea sp. MED297] [Reinekea blandensis MED297]
MAAMTTNKPYMIRAIHEWILDNDCTPYIVFMAEYPGVQVPQDFVRDGQITLNIAPTAVRDLQLANDVVSFNARFGGVPTDIVGPVDAVMAIFAKENGQGMGFEVEMPPEPPEGGSDEDQDSAPPKRPSLKVVK